MTDKIEKTDKRYATTSRMLVLQNADGKFWLDIKDGRFTYGGDVEPDEAAKMFLDHFKELVENYVKWEVK